MSVRLCPDILGLGRVRGLYRAAVSWKDVLDNPFYDKYKKQLQGVQGEAPVNCSKSSLSISQTKHSPSPQTTIPPNLNRIMKVELIHDKPSEEIAKIWIDYHKTKDCISAVLPSSTYIPLQTKAAHCPMFVYPLPRNEGYEMWFAKFSEQRCRFTSLINYQRFQENAPLSLVLTYYTDFLEAKDMVLVHGEVDVKDLSTVEAQNLTNQMHLFYSNERPDLYALVHQFNHAPQEFNYKTLIEKINSVSL